MSKFERIVIFENIFFMFKVCIKLYYVSFFEIVIVRLYKVVYIISFYIY